MENASRVDVWVRAVFVSWILAAFTAQFFWLDLGRQRELKKESGIVSASVRRSRSSDIRSEAVDELELLTADRTSAH